MEDNYMSYEDEQYYIDMMIKRREAHIAQQLAEHYLNIDYLNSIDDSGLACATTDYDTIDTLSYVQN